MEITVEKVIAGGDGLAHLPDGRVLFVPFTLPLERVSVRIVTEKKDYAVGRIEDIIESSARRIKPRCPYYGVCGGCQFQHVSYEGELNIKKGFVGEALTRLARQEFNQLAEYPSENEWEYRTKSEHPAAGHKPDPLIGYYKGKTHKVVDVKECPVLDSSCVNDLNRVRTLLGKSNESVYSELNGEGNLRHVILKRSNRGERLLGLVTYKDHLEAGTARRLAEEFNDLQGVVHHINPRTGNRIMGGMTRIVKGSQCIVHDIAGLVFRVSFESFFQANHSQAGRITRLVREFLEPEPGDVLCDAYAGVGMIGLVMARDVKQVIALEASPAAVEDGIYNSTSNNFSNVKWVEGDVESRLKEIDYNLLVLDPPRRGLSDGVISIILDAKPAKIVYVSCNPSTWARDVSHLTGAGYRLKNISMLDMFPKTSHVEVVSLLEIK